MMRQRVLVLGLLLLCSFVLFGQSASIGGLQGFLFLGDHTTQKTQNCFEVHDAHHCLGCFYTANQCCCPIKR
ncbi:uncharacterized protein LOC111127913 isoform X1 [Crassostrea virginica]